MLRVISKEVNNGKQPVSQKADDIRAVGNRVIVSDMESVNKLHEEVLFSE